MKLLPQAPNTKKIVHNLVSNLPKILCKLTLAKVATSADKSKTLSNYIKCRPRAGKVISGLVGIMELAELEHIWNKVKQKLLLNANPREILSFIDFCSNGKDQKGFYLEVLTIFPFLEEIEVHVLVMLASRLKMEYAKTDKEASQTLDKFYKMSELFFTTKASAKNLEQYLLHFLLISESLPYLINHEAIGFKDNPEWSGYSLMRSIYSARLRCRAMNLPLFKHVNYMIFRGFEESEQGFKQSSTAEQLISFHKDIEIFCLTLMKNHIPLPEEFIEALKNKDRLELKL